MVMVWLFAGGGHSELHLSPFFEKHFPICRFQRKLPIRARGPLPGPAGRRLPLPKRGMGHTGKALQQRLQERLQESLQYEPPPDLLLVVDDLDCRDGPQEEQALRQTVDSLPQLAATPLVVAFAAPEIESWLLADWHNTFGAHSKFKARRKEMQHYLSTTGKVNFAQPEQFSAYDPDKKSCREKLSETIAAAYLASSGTGHFSKKEDSGPLLLLLNPATVAGKCLHFSSFWSALHQHLLQKKLSP
ncbi:MAG: DUF4276 family protein [Magnetococcus sp. XQGC-1]